MGLAAAKSVLESVLESVPEGAQGRLIPILGQGHTCEAPGRNDKNCE